MKKLLTAVAVVLALILVGLYILPLGEGVPVDTLKEVAGILLLVVVVLYAVRYGGIRCPNCGCRIEPKRARREAFEGRFPCPKCGAMIER